MKAEILALKKEKNAIILAHYYTTPEVQDIADFVGDSLALAQKAADTDADIILFAGVHFMAETAKILNRNKVVLIPDMQAGCSLADSCEAEALKNWLKNYPNHYVVSYVNCSSEVKALSDLIITSGNALQKVSALPEDLKIVFVPDRNLGAYINKETGREMVLWDGACHVHDLLTTDAVYAAKEKYPNAKVIAHPECKAVVLALANFVGSTAAMLNYTQNDDCSEYIVVTETGIIHEMQKRSPHKQFHVITSPENCSCSNCEYMKMNTLDNIYHVLKHEDSEITLSDEIIEKAKVPILRMLQKKKKIAVFASGNGSNFEAIVNASKENNFNAEVAILISDNKDSYAITRAKNHNIPVFAFNAKAYTSKVDFEKEIIAQLQKHQVELIVLAGYMRIIGETLLSAYPQQIINIHPSLLPAFAGKSGIEDAYNYGVKIFGVTVHYVNEGVDTGEIIDQECFKAEENESLDSITEKIHKIEHQIYPAVIHKLTK